jgi:hypothetical protein
MKDNLMFLVILNNITATKAPGIAERNNVDNKENIRNESDG